MKLFTPEISWHQKEPIFGVDFCVNTWKLATCGADFTIKIWLVKEKDGAIGLDFIANLDRHCKPVNVVRFSPNGKFLASAGDDGAIILWKIQETDKTAAQSGLFGDEDIVNKETWAVHKMLRGHIEDIYDLAWSPDSSMLMTGSVDNSAIIWDAAKGQNLKILADHKHYVQGVCWDPRNVFMATHSSDRSCRIYKVKNHKCCQNIHKNNSLYKNGEEIVKSKLSKMFLDETMQSFFRRCSFSPDGTFLLLPAGVCDGEDKPIKTTYMFERGQFSRPIKHFPGSKKATVCVKFSPICYELFDDKENFCTLNESEPGSNIKLPYRMIFAVASLDAITFYDTSYSFPIAHCANIHYASLTDIAWSSDGKLAVLSSTDGYCSFVKFDDGELGTPISFDPIQYQIAQAAIRSSQNKEKRKSVKKDGKKKESKKCDFTEQEPNDQKKATANVQEHGVNKNVSTVTDVDVEQKEKLQKIDKNQPTIEKLFSTPVRKRKRPSETSPVSGQTSNTTQDSKPSVTYNAMTPTSNAPPSKEGKRTPKDKSLQKPAKRVNVITLESSSSIASKSGTDILKSPVSDSQTDLSNQPKDKVLAPVAKQPKRISVTTLETYSKSGSSPSRGSTGKKPKTNLDMTDITSKSPINSPPQVQKNPTSPPHVEKNPTSPPQVGKKPISSPHLEKNPASPPHMEKRPTPSPIAEKRPISSPQVEKKSISPPRVEKKAKRIQVITLCKFDSKDESTPKVDSKDESTPKSAETTTSSLRHDDVETSQKEIPVITID